MNQCRFSAFIERESLLFHEQTSIECSGYSHVLGPQFSLQGDAALRYLLRNAFRLY